MAFFDKSSKKKSNNRSDDSAYRRSSDSDNTYSRSSEGRSSYSGNSSGNKVLTRATCSSCGDSCQVPFKPLPGKPVLCNNCFRTKDSNFKDNTNSRASRYEESDRRGYNSEPKSSNNGMADIHAKLDRILKLLE